jgi:GAF domain-containing protein
VTLAIRTSASSGSNDPFDLLCQLVQTIGAARTLDEVYEYALDGIRDTLGVSRASLLLFDDEGVMRFRAWRGLSDSYRAATDGHSPWKPDTTSAAPVLVPDVAADESLAALRPIIEAEGIRALAFLPLVSRGRLLGKFMLYHEQPHDFTSDEISLASVVAASIAFAIDRLQIERQLVFTQERTDRLQSLTAALSGALTREKVVEIVAREGLAALGADSAIVALLSEDRRMFEIIFALNYEPEVVRDWSTFPADADVPFRDAVLLQQPILLVNHEDTAQRYPGLLSQNRAMSEQNSHACVPLSVDGGVTGAISFGFREVQRFTQADEAFMVALGRQCGQALERARLYEVEREARQAAEDASLAAEERSALIRGLQEISEAALHDLTLDELVDDILPRVHQMMDAEETTILLMTEDRTALVVRSTLGFRTNEVGFVVPYGEGFAGTIAANKRPLVVDDIEKIKVRAPLLRQNAKSLLGVPLISKGDVIGVLHVGNTRRRFFDKESVRVMQLIADRVALAIEKTSLIEAERTARAEAERAHNQQQFLARASEILSSSLDLQTTLAAVADICVPFLGDWCVVDVTTAEGSLERVSVVHRDPEKVALAHDLQERYRPDPRSGNGVEAIARTGKPQINADITDEMIEAIDAPRELKDILRGLGLRSSMAVPLIAHAQTVGVLTVISAESGRRYNDDDLDLAMELGRRVALAVENARLYQTAQRIQEDLRKANEAKDEFLGLVSHELRTPVTTIYGGARLLRSRGDAIDADTRVSVLGDLEQEADRLRRIVEDLLVLARLELGAELHTEPVLAQHVAKSAVATFQRRHPNREVRLRVEDIPPVLTTQSYLEQVLSNLLSNAGKYSPHDQPIDVSVVRGEDAAIISVCDRGPGLAEDELDRIFERFYRGAATATQASGAGIGLTVCKRLVEAHGGVISAQLREGGGLEVSFTVPYADVTA